MSFLDNLENNLKNMESREEMSSSLQRDRARAEAEKARSKAAAPFLEQLRKGPFTSALMGEATRIGHQFRTKVYMAWLDNTLRFDAREHRLELKATPEGVRAQFFVNMEPKRSEIVELTDANAKSLAERWMKTVGPRPRPKPEADEE